MLIEIVETKIKLE